MKKNFSIAEDEKVILEIKHSIWPFVAYMVLAVAAVALGVGFYIGLESIGVKGLFTVVIFVVIALGGIIVAVLLVLSLSSERLILTDKRVIGTKGFLARRTTEIRLEKADAVTVSNSLMGAIFKYSTVSVVTPGLHAVSNGTTVGNKFCYVVNAEEFSTEFIKAVEEYNK